MKKSLVVKTREIFRLVFLAYRYFLFKIIYGMNIAASARISFRAVIDKTNPKGIYIGDESYVASGATILSHDYVYNVKRDTKIGKRCFIGTNAVVLPGIIIGDSVIVGAGSIVTKNIPAGCIVAGNPARIIKKNIKTKKFGQITHA